MNQFTMLALAAIIAGVMLQTGVEQATRRFRADPQPERLGQIKFWEWMGVVVMLLIFGGAFALYFFGRDNLHALLDPHLPTWAPPIAELIVPFGGAWLAMLAAKPLATILYGRPTPNPVPWRKNYGAHTPWFAAFNSRRTYKIFLTEQLLCGAHVGGAIDSDGSPTGDETPASWVNTSLATLYDRIDVTSPEFLALDDDNFHFAFRDIIEVGYLADKRWLQPSVPHSGRLLLTLTSGSEYEFLLLGAFDAATLVRAISAAATRLRIAKPATLGSAATNRKDS